MEKSTIFWISTAIVLMVVYILWKAFDKFRKFKKEGLKTNGVLVEYQNKDTHKSTIYFPVVEYETSKGQKIKSISLYGSYGNKLPINTQVEIIYNSHKPEEFCLSSYNPNTYVYMILICILFAYAFLLLLIFELI